MRSKMLIRRSSLALLAALASPRAARADDDDPAKGHFTLEEATKGALRHRVR